MPILSGQTIPASEINALTGAPVILGADYVHPQSNTALANTNLTVPLLANSRYTLELALWVDSSTTADYKIDFVLPASATMWWLETLYETAAGVVYQFFANTGPAGNAANGNGTPTLNVIHGQIQTVGTAGNVTLRFAQNTSHASTSSIKAGSWIRAQRG